MVPLGDNDREFILELTSVTSLPYLDSDVARDFLRREQDPQNAHYDQAEKDALLKTQFFGRHVCYARHLSQKN